MSTKIDALHEKVISLSNGSNLTIDDAVKQWKPHKNLQGTYVCGCHTKFNYGMTILNKLNGNSIDVGHVCVRLLGNAELTRAADDMEHKRKNNGNSSREYSYLKCIKCDEILSAGDFSEHYQIAHGDLIDADHRVMRAYVKYLHMNFVKPGRKDRGYNEYVDFCCGKYKNYKRLSAKSFLHLLKKTIETMREECKARENA